MFVMDLWQGNLLFYANEEKKILNNFEIKLLYMNPCYFNIVVIGQYLWFSQTVKFLFFFIFCHTFA